MPSCPPGPAHTAGSLQEIELSSPDPQTPVERQCDHQLNSPECMYDGGDCCLTLGGSYVFVDGSCYYVEETLFNILGATINCENILGRLFEPRDAFTNHRVMANIKENIPGKNSRRVWKTASSRTETEQSCHACC